MMHLSTASVSSIVLLALAAACAPRTREPARAPAPQHDATPTPLSAAGQPVVADVRFMQHMIVHHAQAIDMAHLVPTRTERTGIRLLAQRIETSQLDEIALMRRWLAAQRQPYEDAALHAGHNARPLMPGMLSPEEMTQLAAVHGDEFDRLFLQSMIRHHQGALVMVADLFASAGAGQEAQLFEFANRVDADQRGEIARMQTLLATLQRGSE